MSEKKGIPEGDPIYIESLMDSKEWAQAHRLFPNTITTWSSRTPDQFTGGNFKWRWRMGGSLTEGEIHNINKELEKALLKVRRNENATT